MGGKRKSRAAVEAELRDSIKAEVTADIVKQLEGMGLDDAAAAVASRATTEQSAGPPLPNAKATFPTTQEVAKTAKVHVKEVLKDNPVPPTVPEIKKITASPAVKSPIAPSKQINSRAETADAAGAATMRSATVPASRASHNQLQAGRGSANRGRGCNKRGKGKPSNLPLAKKKRASLDTIPPKIFDHIIARLREGRDTGSVSHDLIALADVSHTLQELVFPQLYSTMHLDRWGVQGLDAYLTQNRRFIPMIKAFDVELDADDDASLFAPLKAAIGVATAATHLILRFGAGSDPSWHKPSHPTREAIRDLLQTSTRISEVTIVDFLPGMTAILPSRALTRLTLDFNLDQEGDLHACRAMQLQHKVKSETVVFKNVVFYKKNHFEPDSIRTTLPAGRKIKKATRLALDVLLDVFQQFDRARTIAFEDCRIPPAVLVQLCRAPLGRHLTTLSLDNIATPFEANTSNRSFDCDDLDSVDLDIPTFPLRCLSACRNLTLGAIEVDFVSGFPPLLESVVLLYVNTDAPHLWLGAELHGSYGKHRRAIPRFSITHRLDYAYQFEDGPQQVKRLDHRCRADLLYEEAAATDEMLAQEPKVTMSQSFVGTLKIVLFYTAPLRLSSVSGQVEEDRAGTGNVMDLIFRSRCKSTYENDDVYLWSQGEDADLALASMREGSMRDRGAFYGNPFKKPVKIIYK